MPEINLGRVVGPQGPQGETGATGAQGIQGPQGATGEAGKSAYQAAKDGGYTGTEAEFNAILAIIDKHAGRHKKGGADEITPDMIGALSLNGSRPMTGGIVLDNGLQEINGNEFCVQMHTIPMNDDGTIVQEGRRYLAVHNSKSPTYPDIGNALFLSEYTGEKWARYPILHTGNKPYGSYTGNGSATKRTIETGGIGQICIIPTINALTFAYNHGAIILKKDGTVEVLSASECNFSSGVLTLATTNTCVNATSATHAYQVL